MKSLSQKELSDYLEAEKQKIIEKYGCLTEENIRKFAEKYAKEFHNEYFKHDFNK